MHPLAHGVDIVAIARIGEMRDRHGDRFLERVYTPTEREYCLASKTPLVRLAGRFAAKEAVLKVLGTGWRGGIGWTDVETLPDRFGRPHVFLHNECARLATEQGIESVLMSISHAGDYAIASAIGVGSPPTAG